MANNDPDAEVTGRYLVPFIEAAGEVSPVFERKVNDRFEQVVGEVTTDGWYRAGDVWEVYETILDDVGPKTMQQGGEATSHALPFEDDTSIGEAIELLRAETVSEDTYRNTDHEQPGGQYTYDISGRSGRLGTTAGYAYTKPFVKGLYRGIIKQCGPEGSSPEFTEVEPEPDEEFAWHVEW